MFSSNATQVSAVTQAEAVDFDGTNDYLSRSSDFTGNADGKTFTFSCWLWRGEIGSNQVIYQSVDSQYGLYIYPDTSNTLSILGYNSSNTQILNATVTVPFQVGFTFINILISIDMANTANRAVYINDVAATVTWTTYTNAAINFTCPNHTVGQSLKGRLSNVFLDYTYRDLSITANRRLFVTADLKPAAGQAALSPILYLPMSDPTTVGTNAGTGGNFTLNGTIARSGRGPNQYNAPYSALDGAADFLSRTTAPTGIADSKTFTTQFVFRSDNIATGNRDVIAFGQDASNPSFFVRLTSGSELEIQAYNAAGSVFALGANTSSVFKTGRNYVVTISVDLSDTAKRHVYINGESVAVTWSTYSNLTIDFNIATTPKYNIAKGLGTVYYNGQLGAVWFNTSYIDLSVALNLAKFVSGTGINAKPVDLGATGELPTGTAPLIYLPMYGNNAGKNYGTGGDFTVNSGPYTGARGPNEFWGNKANFGATTSNYLSRATALVGNPGSVTTATFCCYFYCNNAATTGTLFGFNSAASGTWQISANRVFVWLGSGYVEFNENVTSSAWHSLLFSRTGSTITAYLDGVALTINSGSSFDYGGAIQFAQTPVNIGVRNAGASRSDPINGQISELYLSSSYIDFSQEANRLKFRDCFGNPVDLSAQITAQSIPTPIVYARFPPTSFGTNSGTGGDFTVTGTITDGGQL